LRRVYKVSSYLLLIGVVHTALTPLFYDQLSVDALWFVGTGLALVFLSLLNIVGERVFEPWALNVCIGANVAGLIYGLLIVFVLPEVQAFVSLLIFLAVAISSIAMRMSLASKPMPMEGGAK
jgi:hypothetical protein